MTWESKRQLQKRLELIERVKDELIDEKNAAAAILESFGYQRVETRKLFSYRGPSIEVNWRRKDGLDALTPEHADHLLEVQADASRRETLTAVIEALGLKGYARGGYVPAGPTIFDTDRLWSEIQTTLRVRAEQKQAAADAKTAEKIGRLLGVIEKDSKAFVETVSKLSSPFASPASVTSTVATATSDLAAKVSDLSARLDATETAKKDKK